MTRKKPMLWRSRQCISSSLAMRVADKPSGKAAMAGLPHHPCQLHSCEPMSSSNTRKSQGISPTNRASIPMKLYKLYLETISAKVRVDPVGAVKI